MPPRWIHMVLPFRRKPRRLLGVVWYAPVRVYGLANSTGNGMPASVAAVRVVKEII